MSEEPPVIPSSAEYEDDLALPDDTLAILQSFLAEKALREKFIESRPETLAESDSGEKPTFDAFEENWVRLPTDLVNPTDLTKSTFP